MSFSKARIRRFNEETGSGTPGVGHYDPKYWEKKGLMGFEKSERFKKLQACDLGTYVPSSASKVKTPFSVPNRRRTTNKRRSLSCSTVTSSIEGSVKNGSLANENSPPSIIDELQKRVVDQDNMIRQLQQHIEILQEQLAQLTKKRTIVFSTETPLMENESMGSSDNLSEAVQNGSVSIDATEALVSSLQRSLQEKEEQFSSLANQLSSVQRSLQEKEEQISYLANQLNSINQNKTSIVIQYAEPEDNENTKIKEIYHSSQESLEMMEATSHCVLRRLSDADDKLFVVELEAKFHQEAAAKATSEIMALNECLSTRDAEIQALQGTLEIKKSQCQDLQSILNDNALEQITVEEMGTKLATLKEQLVSSKEEMQDLKKALEDKENEFQEKSNTWEMVEEKTKQDRVKLKEENIQLEGLVSKLNVDIDFHQKLIEERDLSIEALNLRLLDLNNAKNKIAMENEESSSKANLEIEALGCQLKEMEMECKEAQELISELKSLNGELAEEKMALGSNCEALQSENMKWIQEMDELNVEMEEIKTAHQQLEGLMEDLDSQMAELKEQNESLFETKIGLETKLESAEKLAKTKDVLGKEQRKEISQLATEKNALTVQNEELRSQWQNLTVQYEIVEEKCSFLQEEKETNENHFVEMSKEIQLLTEAGEKIGNNNMRLETLVAQKEAQIVELQVFCDQEKDEKDAFSLETDAQMKDLIISNETLKEQKKQLELRVIELQAEINHDWKAQYEALMEKVAPFASLLDEYSQEKDRLMRDKDDTYKDLQELGKKYAKVMGHQNHKQKIHYVNKVTEENVELKKEVSKLREANFKQQMLIQKLAPDQATTPRKPAKMGATPGSTLKAKENIAFF